MEVRRLRSAPLEEGAADPLYQMALEENLYCMKDDSGAVLTPGILPMLLNRELNPIADMTDLSYPIADLDVCYYLTGPVEGQHVKIRILTHTELDELELTAESLHQIAADNYRSCMEPEVFLLDGEACVVTNTGGHFGAVSVMFPEIMKELEELYQDDFYLLPSSIHEMLTMPVDRIEPQQLLEIIREANHSVVDPAEVLSNHLYRYSVETGEITRMAERVTGEERSELV